MARILGVELPNEKKLCAALHYIYGIGPTRTAEIIRATGISGDKRVKDLKEDELGKIAGFIQQNFKTEGDLRQEIALHIKRLVEINSYRGTRHRHSLPVRGQRTRSNARTRKGPRKTVGVVRDKSQRKVLRQKIEETKE